MLFILKYFCKTCMQFSDWGCLSIATSEKIRNRIIMGLNSNSMLEAEKCPTCCLPCHIHLQSLDITLTSSCGVDYEYSHAYLWLKPVFNCDACSEYSHMYLWLQPCSDVMPILSTGILIYLRVQPCLNAMLIVSIAMFICDYGNV